MAFREVPIDYFSVPAQGLNLKGQSVSKTWFGFILTLILSGVVLAVFISELISMFTRQSLTVSISEVGVPVPPLTNIADTIMAFAITDQSTPPVGLVYGQDFTIYAEIRTWSYYDYNPRKLSITSQTVDIQRCNADYFGELAQDFQKLGNIDDMFCIPRDQSDELLTLRGQLGSDLFKDIRVIFCCGPAGTTTTCPSTFISNNVNFYYASSILDSSNFENPVKQMPVILQDYSDRRSLHERNILITLREIITDTGFVFSNNELKTDLIVSEGTVAIDGINSHSPQVFAFSLRLDAKKITVNRQYKKILDVLATTTGVASTIALIVIVILKPYIDLKAHNNIMKIVAPESYTNISFMDYLKSLIGNEEAREKTKKVKAEQEWIKNNLDLSKMVNSWTTLELMKKKVLGEEVEVLKKNEEEKPLSNRNKKNPLKKLWVVVFRSNRQEESP